MVVSESIKTRREPELREQAAIALRARICALCSRSGQERIEIEVAAPDALEQWVLVSARKLVWRCPAGDAAPLHGTPVDKGTPVNARLGVMLKRRVLGRIAVVIAVTLAYGAASPVVCAVAADGEPDGVHESEPVTIVTGDSRTTVFHWSDNPLVLQDPRQYLLDAFRKYRETMARLGNAQDPSAVGALISASSVAGPGLYVAGDPLQSTRFGKNLLMFEVLPGKTIARAATRSGTATADYFRVHPAIISSTAPAIFYAWDGFFVSQHAVVLRSPVMVAPWDGTLEGTEPLIDLDSAVSVTRNVPAKRCAEHDELERKSGEPLALFVVRFFQTWGDQLPLIIKFADPSQPLAPLLREADGRLSRVGIATVIVEEIAAGPEPIASRLIRLEHDRSFKERAPACLPDPDVCAASLTQLFERALLKDKFREPFLPVFAWRTSTVSQAVALLVELDYLDRDGVTVATTDELIEKLVEHWVRDPRNIARAQDLLDSVDQLRHRLEANNINLWSPSGGDTRSEEHGGHVRILPAFQSHTRSHRRDSADRYIASAPRSSPRPCSADAASGVPSSTADSKSRHSPS